MGLSKLRPLDIKKMCLMAEHPRWGQGALARYFKVDRSVIRHHLKRYAPVRPDASLPTGRFVA
jgi:hypothetical protein